MGFSFNIFYDLQQIFQWPFMQHAFEAGTIVAVLAGVVGYFVVLRRSSFAAHALSDIGFAGAAGAVLFGVNPVYGLLVFTTAGGIGIAILGPKAANRDVEIGAVLSFMLGLGILFLSQYKGYANAAFSILFGEILGISPNAVYLTLIVSVPILIAVAFVYRPLLFSSLDENVAEAKGVPMLLIGIIFMVLVAVATSMAVQVVGVLLIFALMVTPAAIGQRLTRSPARAILISVAIALLATWLGLFLAFYEPYPVSFFITTIVFVVYLLVRFVYPRVRIQKTSQTSVAEAKTHQHG